MRLKKILFTVTYVWGAIFTVLLGLFLIGWWPMVRFVSWLMFEWVIPPNWLGVIGIVFLALLIYGLVSAVLFIDDSARIREKIGKRKKGMERRA